MRKLSPESFTSARFVTTAVQSENFPTLRTQSGEILPEIAILGRSNVGKSSVLNALFQKKGLAKTSSTPGKTQALNFFISHDQLAFVDLPGYGYAVVPESTKKKWGKLLEEYFQKREELRLLLFLFDSRRKPDENDRMLFHWILRAEKPFLFVATKMDKISPSRRKETVKRIAKDFSLSPEEILPFSVPLRMGRRELIHHILFWIQSSMQEHA